MNAFYVIAIIFLALALIALFAAWPLYPFLIAAAVSAVIGFLYSGGPGRL